MPDMTVMDNLYLLLSPEYDLDPPPVPRKAGPSLEAANDVVAVGTWTDWGSVQVVLMPVPGERSLPADAWDVVDEVDVLTHGPLRLATLEMEPRHEAEAILAEEPGRYRVRLYARSAESAVRLGTVVEQPQEQHVLAAWRID